MSVPTSIDVQQEIQSEQVPLPFGADLDGSDEGFECDGERVIWSPPLTVPNSLAGEDIRVSACQRRDGSIVTEGPNAPLVFWSSSSFSIEKTRALAQVLTNAAEMAEFWRNPNQIPRMHPETTALLRLTQMLLNYIDAVKNEHAAALQGGAR